MEPPPYQALDSLVYLSNRIGRQLTQSIWRKLASSEMDISPHHMGVLADLWREDGLRQQDLAISLIRDKGTIARMITESKA
jgi:DNA-binding MarR family transcriptional regulator